MAESDIETVFLSGKVSEKQHAVIIEEESFQIKHKDTPNEKSIESVSRLQIVKQIIVDSGLSSTGHGVPNIFRNDDIRLLQAMWFICVILATAGCFYINIKSITIFFEYDVVTTIRTYSDLPSKFPAITICNINSLISYNASVYAANKIQDLETEAILTNSLSSLFFLGIPDFSRYALTLLAKDPGLNDSFRQSLTLPASTIFLSCLYNLRLCDSSNFSYYFDVNYGNCYRFNSGSNWNGAAVDELTSSVSGKTNGFKLELFVPEPIYNNSYGSALGAHIFVHNKSIVPVYYEGFDAPIGTTTNIVLGREYTTREPKPFSSCVSQIESFNSPFIKIFTENKLTYRQKYCFYYCYQRKVVDQCQCYDVTFPLLTYGKNACTSLSQFVCATTTYGQFFSTGQVFENCSAECPEECESVSYTISQSYSEFPTEIYAQSVYYDNPNLQSLFVNLTTDEQKLAKIKKNVMQINFYYDQLSYTLIEERPKVELADVISNVGGTIGLFLGMSFLSFVELLELIVQIMYGIARVPRNKVSNKT